MLRVDLLFKMCDMVKKWAHTFTYASKRLREDRDFIREAFDGHEDDMKTYVSEKVRHDLGLECMSNVKRVKREIE